MTTNNAPRHSQGTVRAQAYVEAPKTRRAGMTERRHSEEGPVMQTGRAIEDRRLLNTAAERTPFRESTLGSLQPLLHTMPTVATGRAQRPQSLDAARRSDDHCLSRKRAATGPRRSRQSPQHRSCWRGRSAAAVRLARRRPHTRPKERRGREKRPLFRQRRAAGDAPRHGSCRRGRPAPQSVRLSFTTVREATRAKDVSLDA